MSSIELLQRQIHTAEELQSVVKMMKVLAALNIHQYEQAVNSLAEYNRTIERGLHVVLKFIQDRNHQVSNGDRPKFFSQSGSNNPIGRCGVIVFGSEQGMCGQFNEQISHYAIAELGKLQIAPEDLTMMAIGSRLISHLETKNYAIEQNFAMPSSLTGITSKVQEILFIIANWRDQEQVGQILLFYNQLQSNTFYEPKKIQLFPLDRQWLKQIENKGWNSRTIPIFTMFSKDLISSLLRQYFFISLYRSFGESLASENASRLASMQVAEKNIEERLGEFRHQFQHKRQSEITEELLEIISAFEVENTY